VAAHTFLQHITDAGRLITDAISRAVVVSGVPYYVVVVLVLFYRVFDCLCFAIIIIIIS